ncbi:hypothetical protein PYK79_41310 [Streptomyces sp. ID05-04B]|uniref:hypothetical protein n=1 Tax=Streptomyces sp. ID05-04B TaxID=3028661 RepID=UPI0029C4A8D9|nr:hypothetical protein [Streptomyces sp. ID05-04B]MDX5568443.1 hypothetical protein [Streptomyces sp. ID05-04B]
MTGQPPSLADWLQMLCLAVAVFEACSVPFWLLADADLADFDPRPAVRRMAAAGRQTAVHAGHDLNWFAASARHEIRPLAAYEAACVREDVLLLLAAPHTPEMTR